MFASNFSEYKGNQNLYKGNQMFASNFSEYKGNQNLLKFRWMTKVMESLVNLREYKDNLTLF